MTTKHWRCIFTATGVLLASILLAFLVKSENAVAGQSATHTTQVSDGDCFIYQFDPDTSSYVFTFTIPTANTGAWDIIAVPAVGHQEIWFTEPSADRIGKLVYTDTITYSFQEYLLTAGSMPLNLIADSGFIWFTEAGLNRVGRLDPTTGQVDEFDIPTADSYPAGLDAAPDGSIWFTQMMADQLAHLVVTSTIDYSVTEYAGPTMSGGRPYGVVVSASGTSIHLAQTLNDRVTRFTPSTDLWVDIKILSVPDEPYRLTQDSTGQVWGTERGGNRIDKFAYGTFPIINPIPLTPVNSLPTSLIADVNNYLWFTQMGANQIGRAIPATYPVVDYYPLPLSTLIPTGIASDGNNDIWILAQMPYHVYLPSILRD